MYNKNWLGVITAHNLYTSDRPEPKPEEITGKALVHMQKFIERCAWELSPYAEYDTQIERKEMKQAPEPTIKDYKKIIKAQNSEIEALKDKLQYASSIRAGKCCDCCYDAIQDLADLQVKIECFNDTYLKGLSYESIAELAKKSLKLTSDNCIMIHLIEDIQDITRDIKNSKEAMNAIRLRLNEYNNKDKYDEE